MKLTKLKKTLALLLSAAMVFSAFPVTAMADTESVAVGGAEETIEASDDAEAATEDVDAEVEESTESQDIEVFGVEEDADDIDENNNAEKSSIIVDDREELVGKKEVFDFRTKDGGMYGNAETLAPYNTPAVAPSGNVIKQ